MQVMHCIRAPVEGGAKNCNADLIIKESNSAYKQNVNVILFLLYLVKAKHIK